jgi:alkylation response protein AidB-like acyl-CoA dehydrogenase
MDFDFSEQQLMIRQLTRDFLARASPPTAVRKLLQDPRGFDEAIWSQFAELGLPGLAVPEADGGQGLGMVELALVLEEMGRAAYPSPFFATAVLAATALIAGGTEEQKARYLPDIAAGRTKATLALHEDYPAWDPAAVRLDARRDGGRYVLNGRKSLVPYAQVADLLLIPARTTESGNPARGITLFAVPRNAPGLEIRPLTTLDLTTRVADVVLREVSVGSEQIVGRPDEAWPILETVLEHAAVGAAAEMLGAARKSLEMSVEYAASRVQFGQPIGSFQAVKHKCAEMLLAVEQSHAATYYAAWALDASAEDAALAASVAKAFVSEAARKVCGDAIQVHGGIGFTWEFDLHLYFKRAKHLEPLYGDADFHRERALTLRLKELAPKEVVHAS